MAGLRPEDYVRIHVEASDCPNCGAKAGAPCIGVRGPITSMVHVGRKESTHRWRTANPGKYRELRARLAS